MSDYDYLFKVIVVGDGAVGKTALTIRFAEGRFQDHYKMTIGVDFAIKMVEIDGRKVKLQIWDTGGQERFSYIRPLYYKGAMGVIFVFDITNRSSFEHLSKWFKEVSDYCGSIPSVLVANKCDLPDKAVTTQEAEQMATHINGPFYEASAKTGDNVDDLFTMLGKILIQQEGIAVSMPTPAPKPTPIAKSTPISKPTPPLTPAPSPISAPPPAPAPSPISAPPPAPAPSPISAPPPTPQKSGDSLEDALSFLNTEEPTPTPSSIPEPAPAPSSIPEPIPTPIYISEPASMHINTQSPVPFTSQPKIQAPPPKQPSTPAPTPFSSFLTPSRPEETQSSGFIPFIPETPKKETPKIETQPFFKPASVSYQEPTKLEVTPVDIPSMQNSCPNCGKTISSRWKFCTFCGTPLK